MLIPGLPPAGAQQDPLKLDRKLRPGAIGGVPGDPVSELPLDEGGSSAADQHSAGDQTAPHPESESDQPTAKAAPAGAAELPRKGLLVDIRA